jgi:PIN like domain
MKSKFIGYYRPTEEEFAQLWKECFFVFDASALHNLYRYSDETSNQLMKVLEVLHDRIWLPYQVAHEFHRNRLTVLAQSEQEYESLETQLKIPLQALRSFRHPFIGPDQLSSLESTITSVCAELQRRKAAISTRLTSDPIRDKLFGLLQDKVGDPMLPDRRDQIYKEGAIRFANKMPPGFRANKKKDKKANLIVETENPSPAPAEKHTDKIEAKVTLAEKTDDVSSVASGEQRRYGDLILWFQIIDEVKKRGKDVIFVTDDRKEDWWELYGYQPLGPRPELIQEMFDKTGKRFHMYKPDRFIDQANNFLSLKINQKAIEEAKEAEKEKVLQAVFGSLTVNIKTPLLSIKGSVGSMRDARRLVTSALLDALTRASNELHDLARQNDIHRAKHLMGEIALTITRFCGSEALKTTRTSSILRSIARDLLVLTKRPHLTPQAQTQLWDYAIRLVQDACHNTSRLSTLQGGRPTTN